MPFSLTHGGFQIQIEQTKQALADNGVDTDHLRWWDASQRVDLIHYFGRPPAVYIQQAHSRGIKVVLAELLTETGSRSRPALWLQRNLIAICNRALPAAFRARLAWDAYRMADAAIALTAWEATLMRQLFKAPAERVHVVPNGVEEIFFSTPAGPRGRWLVCTATITARKRVLELAEAAIVASVPVWVIGKPYSDADPYAQRFLRLVAGAPDLVRFEGAVTDRARLAAIYREARGFVLLSTMESLSLSALEAVACECPVLLSDLPWARSVFGDDAHYCPIGTAARTAPVLRRFYDEAPGLRPPGKPATWREVARQLTDIYEMLLSTSR